jgi:hypothetical protein
MSRDYYEPGGRKSYNDGLRIVVNSIIKPIEACRKVSASHSSDGLEGMQMTPLCWFFLVVSVIFELIIVAASNDFLSFVGSTFINLMTTLTLMFIAQLQQDKRVNMVMAVLVSIVGSALSLVALYSSDSWFAGFVDYFIVLHLLTILSATVLSLDELYSRGVKITYLVLDIIAFSVLISTDSFAVSLSVALLYLILFFVIKTLFAKAQSEEK